MPKVTQLASCGVGVSTEIQLKRILMPLLALPLIVSGNSESHFGTLFYLYMQYLFNLFIQKTETRSEKSIC